MTSLVLMAVLAAGAPAKLVLPPTPDWVEVPDPAKARLFTNSKHPDVLLRVKQEPTLRLDYSLPVLRQLARSFAKANQDTVVGEPKVIVAEGVSIGEVEFKEGDKITTNFYVPSEGGDFLVSVMAPGDQPFDLTGVRAALGATVNLRKPDSVGPGVMIGMAAASLTMLGIVLVLLLRKKKAPAAT